MEDEQAMMTAEEYAQWMNAPLTEDEWDLVERMQNSPSSAIERSQDDGA